MASKMITPLLLLGLIVFVNGAALKLADLPETATDDGKHKMLDR